MGKIYKIVWVSLLLALFVGCNKEDRELRDSNTKDAFLLYSASANNLEEQLWADVLDMRDNYVRTTHKHIFVLHKDISKEPTLYKIELIDNKNELVVVKRYEVNAHVGTPEMLRTVIEDVNAISNVANITDIMFSSHGSSWLPDDTYIAALSHKAPWRSGTSFNRNSIFEVETTPAPQTYKSEKVDVENQSTSYSFGQDYADKTLWLDVNEMADVLEPYNLNTIIFDACYMGSIEVLYELRNSAKYILASPAEILSEGMDYVNSVKYYNNPMNLETMAQLANISYSYYQARSGFDQSATFTVTDTQYLEEFSEVVEDILTKYAEHTYYTLYPTPPIYYDAHIGYAYDYKIYLEKLIEFGGGDADLETKLEGIWYKAFPYYNHTDILFDFYNIEASNGVAGYIYHGDYGFISKPKSVVEFYETQLEWGRIVSTIPVTDGM